MAVKKTKKAGKAAGKQKSKATRKRVKVKKGSEYVCGLCGNVLTIDTVEDFDGVYGYIQEDAIICCGEVMKGK